MNARTEKTSKPTTDVIRQVGFFRRLGAIFYDAILLLAVLFFAASLTLPFNQGEAITSIYFTAPYYLLVSYGFYGWFWTNSGQTVGLKTWKLQLQTFDGQVVTWKHVSIRFLAAMLSWSLGGLGFLWVLVDKNNYTLHDYLSKTYLVFKDTK